MSAPISDSSKLLRAMDPELREGVYVFVSLPPGSTCSELGLDPLATFREKEGLSVIVAEHEAQRAGLPMLFRAAWISLTVCSDLHAVGLTAAVATALAEEGISCNVVAGAFHESAEDFTPTQAHSRHPQERKGAGTCHLSPTN